MRTISLFSIRRTSAMPVSRMLAASSRGRAARSMRTTAVFLAVVASGAGKEPRRATVCVRESVPATIGEGRGGHVRLRRRTVAEDALELKLAESGDVGEGGRHAGWWREEESNWARARVDHCVWALLSLPRPPPTATRLPVPVSRQMAAAAARSAAPKMACWLMVVSADGLPSVREQGVSHFERDGHGHCVPPCPRLCPRVER